MDLYGDRLTLYINGYVNNLHDAEDLLIEVFAYLVAKRISGKISTEPVKLANTASIFTDKHFFGYFAVGILAAAGIFACHVRVFLLLLLKRHLKKYTYTE